MSGGYTKGPWRLDSRGVYANGWTEVAVAEGGHVYDEFDSDPPELVVSQEDGALIAAAPDLLEALIDALTVLTVPLGVIYDPDPAIERARAAIAKAIGETP